MSDQIHQLSRGEQRDMLMRGIDGLLARMGVRAGDVNVTIDRDQLMARFRSHAPTLAAELFVLTAFAVVAKAHQFNEAELN